jgi:CDP-4-dehydro-6-deoxyglucose reductase
LTRTITFLPSGRTGEIEAHETVLDACLRSGLSPNYGCSNGNCGDCRARLVAGEVEKVKHHDYALTAAEKANGTFLMCAHRALSDIEIEADVTQSPEDIPRQVIETKVKEIEHLDPQVIKLHLQTPRSQRLRFVAGQSVTLTIGDEVQTSIAVASCPCDDRNLHFHIPLIPGNAFSEAVFSGDLAPRASVTLSGPERGEFYLDVQTERDSIILSWHTGFAPVISLMEHIMSLEIEKEVDLYRFSPTPDHQYLSNLCRSWADAYDTIRAKLMPDRLTLLSDVAACEEAFASIAARYADLPERNVYVSGPPAFVEAARAVFSRPDHSAGQFRAHTDWVGIFD